MRTALLNGSPEWRRLGAKLPVAKYLDHIWNFSIVRKENFCGCAISFSFGCTSSKFCFVCHWNWKELNRRTIWFGEVATAVVQWFNSIPLSTRPWFESRYQLKILAALLFKYSQLKKNICNRELKHLQNATTKLKKQGKTYKNASTGAATNFFQLAIKRKKESWEGSNSSRATKSGRMWKSTITKGSQCDLEMVSIVKLLKRSIIHILLVYAGGAMIFGLEWVKLHVLDG